MEEAVPNDTNLLVDRRMKILFITNSPMATMGGYQTLIMRMSDYLIKKEHSVYLIAQGLDDRLRSEFNEGLAIQTSGTSFLTLYERGAFKEFYSQCDLPKFDVTICIDMASYIIGSMIKLEAESCNTRVVLGLFQPDSVRQLKSNSPTALLVRWILKKQASSVSVVAMTKRLQVEWNLAFGRHAMAGFIPLPVDLKPFRDIERRPKPYKIVSVGRLDDYKTYNLFMPAIIRRLVDQGFDMSYEIYGEGVFRPQIEALVEELGLKERISLMGYLPYAQFPEVLEEAYAFIGMGTAAIEAAAAGVPTIYSAPRDMAGVTHGLLHRFDLTELGGFAEETNPTLKVKDVLRGLLNLETEQYKLECQKSHDSMELYSMGRVMSQYEVLLDASVEARPRSIWGIWLYCDLIRVVRKCRNMMRNIYSKLK